MPDLTALQINVLQRLFEAGFRLIAIPPYENVLCIHQGECAALLKPVPGGGLQLLAPPTYIIEGNLGVKLKKGSGEVFVWKQKEIPATPQRLEVLEAFRRSLASILEESAPQ